jgi:hypothetical protein
MTLRTGREGAVQTDGSGALNAAAPALKAQQITQLASWVCCWPPSSLGADEWLRQIPAAASGSEMADATAQLAPIGARICTISAIMKIGTYRVSRRILKTRSGLLIIKPTASRGRYRRFLKEINAWLAGLFPT